MSSDSNKRDGLAAGAMVVLIATLLGGLVRPASARAQDGDPRVADARTHFDAAEAHYSQGQYALAAQEFQRAHQLLRAAGHDNAGMVLFNVGRALQELGGRDAEARDAYAGFLAEVPVTDETAERIRTAQSHLRELEARLAHSGDGTRDGQSTADGGDVSPVGPIFLSVGGAMLVSGLVMAGVAYARDQDLIALCPERVGCDVSLRPEVDANFGLALAGDIVWIVGAFAAAVGLVLTLVLREGDSGEVALDLRGGSDGASASLRWRFP